MINQKGKCMHLGVITAGSVAASSQNVSSTSCQLSFGRMVIAWSLCYALQYCDGDDVHIPSVKAANRQIKLGAYHARISASIFGDVPLMVCVLL